MGRGPKITVIGAGSYFFGRAIIGKMASSPVMKGGTLALVDTDPRALKTMRALAERVLEATRSNVRLLASSDRRQVMQDSDFVVLTFSERNAHFRGLDTMIAARHGIRMCSADTIGPGGIFRALREVPHALAMARDVAEIAPGAWVINFVNPTAVLGISLSRRAPRVKSFALCDGNHEPYATLHWCKTVGILPEDAEELPAEVRSRLDLAVGGVNHCTWVVRFRFDGRDMLPVLRARLADQVEEEKRSPGEEAKPRYNNAYALALFDLYGAYPTAVSHTKEYVPFFQGYGVLPAQPEPIRLFDAAQRSREMADAWEVTERYASARLGVKEFMATVQSDHASDIMESMWGNLRRPFFINTPNRGAVTNLPPDAFLELRCDVDMSGPRPHPFGEMPRGLLSLQQRVLDTHELTAEAAATGDRRLLRLAMLTDPLCCNIGDADACIAELLEAEQEALPPYWRG